MRLVKKKKKFFPGKSAHQNVWQFVGLHRTEYLGLLK
jgi:hypothetical protein